MDHLSIGNTPDWTRDSFSRAGRRGDSAHLLPPFRRSATAAAAGAGQRRRGQGCGGEGRAAAAKEQGRRCRRSSWGFAAVWSRAAAAAAATGMACGGLEQGRGGEGAGLPLQQRRLGWPAAAWSVAAIVAAVGEAGSGAGEQQRRRRSSTQQWGSQRRLLPSSSPSTVNSKRYVPQHQLRQLWMYAGILGEAEAVSLVVGDVVVPLFVPARRVPPPVVGRCLL
ncbi:hypothetical protein Taro_047439 [Colocasia esculenta]|uniref:Uncharacterized protein n=1 Tax=Colocasia esculenta TaxID=4460 RepID=A0A843X7X5_COLES|nr:hypothetical protein [Colocasia esculenta]